MLVLLLIVMFASGCATPERRDRASVVALRYDESGQPFEYMLAVVRNQEAAKADPGRWMPWNYRERLVETVSPCAA